MTVRMRHTRAHTRNRRAHHAISAPELSKCKECGSLYVMHRMCENCGKYKGRMVIDVQSKIAKKAERIKRKRKELGQEPERDTDKK